jgi:poly-gamma-glutamate synthesis protein (capsule biosynthesis protein)
VIKIAAVGDICLGDHYFNVGHGTGSVLESTSLVSLCEEVAGVFSGSDIVFGNLESPLRRTKPRSAAIGDHVFVGRTSVARELSALGFNAINVANNHILQHGEGVFHETISSLIDSGINPVGLVAHSKYHCEPVVHTVGAKVVCILGYSDVNETYSSRPTPYAQFDTEKVSADIQNARGWADVVSVSLHFGTEGIALPTRDAIRKARWLIDDGADVVLGHHPHVFQPVEKYKNGWILYSMGNFIFDLFWRRDYIESAISEVVIGADGGIEVGLTPIRLGGRRSLKRLHASAASRFASRNRSLLAMMSSPDEAGYDRMIEKLIVRSNRQDVLAKSLHFFRNIARGHSAMKLRFVRDKIFK